MPKPTNVQSVWTTHKILRANLGDIHEAVKACLGQDQILPALILIYSTIDSVSSLERRDHTDSRAAFLSWVERYMQLDVLRCNALDLYAARCGILHTFSGDSDLSKAGKAHPIVYAWGSYPAEALGGDGKMGVHVVGLNRAVFSGIGRWWEDVRRDEHRLSSVADSLGKWFVLAGK